MDETGVLYDKMYIFFFHFKHGLQFLVVFASGKKVVYDFFNV